MKRITSTFLFAIVFQILSGQVYTENVQASTGGPLELHSLSVDDSGRLYTTLYKLDTLVPPPARWGTALITRHKSNLDIDLLSSLLPTDSLPIIWHGLSRLNNGSLLSFFSINGTNGFDYQWSGYTFALLNPLFQSQKKGYDTATTHLRVLDTRPVNQADALSLIFEPDSLIGSTFIKLWHPATGNIRWQLNDSLLDLSLVSLRFEDVYSFSDSLRVFLKYRKGFGVLGARSPHKANVPRKMITLNKTTGALGQVRSLPKELVSINGILPNKNYGLLYLDSSVSTLRYEKRDSSWQVVRQQTIHLDSLLPQLKIKTVPQVLSGRKGIGFIAHPRGGGLDTLYYCRLNLQGQFVQRERIDSLAPGLNFSYSLPGPGGSYYTALWSRRNWYLLKAQPRNRIGLRSRKILSKSLQIGPIPATDQLQLNIDPTQHQDRYPYQIHGFTGQIYQRGQLRFSGGEATLDISNLPPGSYILMLGEGKERYRARFMVE